MEIYLFQNEKQTGPFTEDQIRKLIWEGNLEKDDYCWHEGLEDWEPIHSVLGFEEKKQTPPAISKKSPQSRPAVVQALAQKKRKSEFAGAGCIVQGIGLLAPIAGGILADVPGMVIGGIALVVLFIAGSIMSQKWVCGNCGNPLYDKSVSLCPACKSQLR